MSDTDPPLAKLMLELHHSFFTTDGNLAPRHRRRYVQALHYITNYLDERGAPDDVVEELQELSVALLDLDKGIVRPFLQAASVENGRRPDPGDIWLVRAPLAAAIALMVRSGMTEVAALAKIEKDYGFLRPLLAPTADTLSSAAKGWCRKLRGGACKNAHAQRFYSQLPQPTRDECSAAAQELLTEVIRGALALDNSHLTTREKESIRRDAQRVASMF